MLAQGAHGSQWTGGVMNIALFVIAAVLIGGALAIIGTIGKERKPVTHGQAIFIVLIQAVMAGLIIAAALRLP